MSEINECEDQSCPTPKQCVDLIDDFECRCPVGYTGDACDIGNIYV